MIGDDKIVYFEKYCPECIYFSMPEDVDPCHACLSAPVNQDTHRPTEFIGSSTRTRGKEVTIRTP